MTPSFFVALVFHMLFFFALAVLHVRCLTPFAHCSPPWTPHTPHTPASAPSPPPPPPPFLGFSMDSRDCLFFLLVFFRAPVYVTTATTPPIPLNYPFLFPCRHKLSFITKYIQSTWGSIVCVFVLNVSVCCSKVDFTVELMFATIETRTFFWKSIIRSLIFFFGVAKNQCYVFVLSNFLCLVFLVNFFWLCFVCTKFFLVWNQAVIFLLFPLFFSHL